MSQLRLVKKDWIKAAEESLVDANNALIAALEMEKDWKPHQLALITSARIAVMGALKIVRNIK